MRNVCGWFSIPRSTPMVPKHLADVGHVCLLVLIPGLTAWLCGRPLIFPSLGPSAFALVFHEHENRARRVIGGHLIGVVSGLIAHGTLASGLSLAPLAPQFSSSELRVAASGVLSVGLTTSAMLLTRASHAPACATTLIVSLGMLSGIVDGLLIMAAVVGMFVSHRVILQTRRVGASS